MAGTTDSESRASIGCIRNRITNMPTTVNGALNERGNRHRDATDRRGLVVDLEHQLTGARAVVERQRQPLGVGEHVASQVEHHLLVEPRVDVVVNHRQAVLEAGDQQPSDHSNRQQLVAAEAVQRRQDVGQRPAAEHRVDDDGKRPGREQRGHHTEPDQTHRPRRQPAVRPQVGQDPPEVAEERPGVRGFAVAAEPHRSSTPTSSSRSPRSARRPAATRSRPSALSSSAASAPAEAIAHSHTANADQHRQHGSHRQRRHRLAGPGGAGRQQRQADGGAHHRRRHHRPDPAAQQLEPAAVLLDRHQHAGTAGGAARDLQVPAVVGAAADDAGAAATGGGLDPADPLLGRLPSLEPAGDPAPAGQRHAAAAAAAPGCQPQRQPAGQPRRRLGQMQRRHQRPQRRASHSVTARTQVRAGTGDAGVGGGHAHAHGQQRREHDRAAPHPRHQRQRRQHGQPHVPLGGARELGQHALGCLLRLEGAGAPGAVIDARRPHHAGAGAVVEAAGPGHVAAAVVALGPLALEQRLGLAVALLLPPVAADAAAAPMPDQRGRMEAQRQPLLLQPPAGVDVVAGDPELRIEAAHRQQVDATVGHVAAGDVLGLDVGHQHVHGPAGRVGDAGGDRPLVGGRDVGTADRGVVGGGEHGGQEPKPVRVGHGVVVNIGNDVSGGSGKAAVASRAEAAIVGADQPHVVAGGDARR